MTEDKLPWIIRLLYDLPYALDLTDDLGEPDHDKMLPAFTAIGSMVFLFTHSKPSWEAMVFLVIIGGYVYGYSAWSKVADKVSDAIGQRIARGPAPDITSQTTVVTNVDTNKSE